MPSKIEWTGETWNPIRARLKSDPARVGWHCTHKSDGCRFCYAERMNRRGIGTGLDYKPGNEKLIEIYLDERVLARPLRWRKPRLIFPCSMTDFAADFVTEAMLDRIFAVPALTAHLTYQFLTKRPARAHAYILEQRRGRPAPRVAQAALALWRTHRQERGGSGYLAIPGSEFDTPNLICWPLPNVWMGTSVEDARVKHRIDELRQVPAAVRFLSIEPLIGPLGELDLSGIDWVIVGGESGPGARPMHPDWAREVRDQCAMQGVPFFFKQNGEWIELSGRELLEIRDAGRPQPRLETVFADPATLSGRAASMFRLGKRSTGRELDGVTHDAMPGR